MRVPDSQNKAAKEVHPEIRGVLEAELEDLLETFLSGSYSRRVQVVKLKDIDIIVVLDDPEDDYFASADYALETIRKRKAARESDLVRRTRKRVRAVELSLHDHEFTIDLVAAFIGHLRVAAWGRRKASDSRGRPSPVAVSLKRDHRWRMCFEVVGEIERIEIIAKGPSLRERARLREQYGRGRWRKLKGVATV